MIIVVLSINEYIPEDRKGMKTLRSYSVKRLLYENIRSEYSYEFAAETLIQNFKLLIFHFQTLVDIILSYIFGICLFFFFSF